MRRVFVVATFVLIVLAGLLAVVSAVFKPIAIETASVEVGKAQETVYATGRVEALERRTLRAQRAAVIAEIYQSSTGNLLREGDVVTAGQRILRLRDSGLQSRKNAAHAELKRVTEQLADGSPYRRAFESQISEAKEQAADTRSREQRLKKQLETGGISLDAYDLAKTNADVADQRLLQLQQSFAQALEDLQAAQTLAHSELGTLSAQEQDDILTAPIGGVLLTLPLEVGEFAIAGTEVAKVGDLRKLIIEAEVNEDDMGRVRLAQDVIVRLAGYEKTKVMGTVVEILPDADRATKGFTIKVEFAGAKWVAVETVGQGGHTEVEEGARPLSGMTAELGIVVNERDNAVTFPRPALTLNNSVYVVEGSRVREVRIELGLVNFSKCEARSGLQPGDIVAVSNVKELSDGARIKPQE